MNIKTITATITFVIMSLTCSQAIAIELGNYLQDIHYWDNYNWSQLYKSDIFKNYKYNKLKVVKSKNLVDLYERDVILDGVKHSLKVSQVNNYNYFRLVSPPFDMAKANSLLSYLQSKYGNDYIFNEGSSKVNGKFAVISKTYRWNTNNTAITFYITSYGAGYYTYTILMIQDRISAIDVKPNFILACEMSTEDKSFVNTLVFYMAEDDIILREADLTATNYFMKTSGSDYRLSKHINTYLQI